MLRAALMKVCAKHCQALRKYHSDSPADFIWRWHIVGCGIHLGNDDVGIISKLKEQRRENINRL